MAQNREPASTQRPREDASPIADADRLLRGLPLESGEAQPAPARRPH